MSVPDEVATELVSIYTPTPVMPLAPETILMSLLAVLPPGFIYPQLTGVLPEYDSSPSALAALLLLSLLSPQCPHILGYTTCAWVPSLHAVGVYSIPETDSPPQVVQPQDHPLHPYSARLSTTLLLPLPPSGYCTYQLLSVHYM